MLSVQALSLFGLLAMSGEALGRNIPDFRPPFTPGWFQPTVQPTPTVQSTTTVQSNAAVQSSATDQPTPTVQPTAAGTSGKPVFFHYMIGGITDAHCEQDITDAQALGADGFVLNLGDNTDSWATDTVASLFNYAATNNFKLFFSFDMTGFNNPDQFTDFLLSYVTSSAYYTYNDLPFVTTFNGGASGYTFGQDSVSDGWQVQLKDVMSNAGHPIYFIPAFQDVPASSTFFETYPVVDGAMNWNSWPFTSDGDVVVNTTDDETYMTGAHAIGKTFMMGMSPLQFKHMDSNNNWYRRGEQNLEYRFGEVLSLQPDFIEMQTWNDAGESHYLGNIWPEPMSGSPAIQAYSNNYDHTGYWQILPSFIQAWKRGDTNTDNMFPTNGAIAQGTFWHHTLLANADCSSDALGKPSGIEDIQDMVTVVVLVASNTTSLTLSISSGGNPLGSTSLNAGYNSFSVSGLTTGTVVTTVTDGSGATVVSGTGPIDVVNSSDLCNYNFQVIGLS